MQNLPTISLPDNGREFTRKVQFNDLRISFFERKIYLECVLLYFPKEEAKENTQIPKLLILIANNAVKMDNEGNISEKGNSNEFDFWLSYITGQSYDVENLLAKIAEAQEKKGTFDIL
jgi:hypothetical protein